MQELIPVGFGLLLGAMLGFARPSVGPLFGAAGVLLLGFAASAVTGELEVSWGFLLVDVPLVALAAFVALQVGRRLSPAWRASR
jgi:hypothetical protein